MPPILTQVARSSDALPLVATSTPTHNLAVSNQQQQDAKKLMRSMTAGYVSMVNVCFGVDFDFIIVIVVARMEWTQELLSCC